MSVNEKVQQIAKSVFGEDIVKDAYTDDGEKVLEFLEEGEIELKGSRVFVEFVNGKRVKIWSSGNGGVGEFYGFG
ncbi:hypothetical protein ABE073_04215 [Lederbergia citrisecunda]|uniref:hypothetical protein n=1 Tax=Lederbergia citrisecunda TaxID=2833583 RepID=UPI003D28405F